ncbi:alpha-L-fucosidase [Dyella sp.]|uniref:alpha-L-fucosidase n=1 Tax=Dyella sp. TaxID=1869338 RepID=UPI002ED05A22
MQNRNTAARWLVLGTMAWAAMAMNAQAAKGAGPSVRPLDAPQPPAGPGPGASTVKAWQDRKFGMFIHFGLYSVAGGMWQGKRVDNGYSEQIMANAPVPLKDYEALAAQFDPVRFDPDAIVALAKAAGMKFIVITAKHHDGFNLFHTAQTPYNTVDGTPYRKDIVKQLAQACARGGLQFGVYYSTIDWHHPGGNTYIEGNSNPITPQQEAFNVAQLKELLGHYGPIAEIWFDMGKPTPAQSAHFAQTVHALQPQTMISGRVWNYRGDFAVMGDNSEPDVGMELPWQAPASIFPQTWGYRSWQVRDDLPGKIRENITRLVRVVSQGGNYILNIGPEGDGSVVPYEAQVLQGIGQWMKRNGQAIYATTRQPFPALDFGYATQGRDALYLFVDKPPADHRLHLKGVKAAAFGAAYRLGAPASTVAVSDEGDGVSIDLDALHGWPATHSDLADFMPVLVLPLHGTLRVRPPALPADAQGQFALDATHAEHFLNYNGEGYEAPATLYKLAWTVDAKAPSYRVNIEVRAPTASARMDVWVDGQRHAWSPGQGALHIRRAPGALGQPMQVELTPVAPFVQGTALPVEVQRVSLVPEH